MNREQELHAEMMNAKTAYDMTRIRWEAYVQEHHHKSARIFSWLLGESPAGFPEFPVSEPGRRYGFRDELRRLLDEL